jgi:hypothetical protein
MLLLEAKCKLVMLLHNFIMSIPESEILIAHNEFDTVFPNDAKVQIYSSLGFIASHFRETGFRTRQQAKETAFKGRERLTLRP